MKVFFCALLLLISTLYNTVGQTVQTDSLKRLLALTHKDTSRVLLLVQIASNYRFFNPDSALLLAQHSLALSEKLNFNKGKMQGLNVIAEIRRFRGEFPEALEAQFNSLQISKNISNKEGNPVLWVLLARSILIWTITGRPLITCTRQTKLMRALIIICMPVYGMSMRDKNRLYFLHA